MIRFRGGFRTLGLHGLISKLAITWVMGRARGQPTSRVRGLTCQFRSDVAIALSFEVSPFLRGGDEFEFRDDLQHIPLRLALNTPFISTLVPFSCCSDALRIHPAVTSVLDDMRFLLAAVLALPERPSAKQLQKVYTTSAWIHQRISSLPAYSPAPAGPSAVHQTTILGHDSGTTPETGAEHHHQQQHQQQPARGPSRGPQQQYQTASHPLAPALRADDRPRLEEGSSLAQPADDLAPDYVYQAVRQAALLYSRAIMLRRPFSLVVTGSEFLQLWTTAWRVPLATWRSLLGVLNWILLPIVSGGGAAEAHGRFVKGMLNISLLQMGMNNWEIAWRVMEAALGLQRWLAAEAREPSPSEEEADDGGGATMSQHGSGIPYAGCGNRESVGEPGACGGREGP